MARLGDVCFINPKGGVLEDNCDVSFIPMQNVSEDGTVDVTLIRKYGDVKKGFTNFQNGDILFAKITPCMENGKGCIVSNLKNGVGFGSTEFHILRPKLEFVSSRWIYYLTSWPEFRKECEKNMTGSAGQKRVPKAFLENYQIEIPALEEQERIADLLDKVNDLIAKRRAQLDKLDLLVKARFVEMFGSCKCYEALSDADIYISDGNYSSKYPTTDEFVEDGIPFIRACNMIGNTISDKEMYYISEKKHKELLKGHVKPFDVLIATRGAIGKIAIVPESHSDSNINAQIVLLRCDREEYNPLYLLWYLKLHDTQMKIQSLVSGSAQPQLPIKRLVQLELLKPSITNQDKFSNFAKQTDKVKMTIQQSLEKLEILKKVLMQQYFG